MDITKIALDVPCDGYACFTPARYLIGSKSIPQECLRVCDKHFQELSDAFYNHRKAEMDLYVKLQKEKIAKKAINELKADDIIALLSKKRLNKDQKKALLAIGKGE